MTRRLRPCVDGAEPLDPRPVRMEQVDAFAVGHSTPTSPGDGFTLSSDSRPFPDGSYPLNYMNW